MSFNPTPAQSEVIAFEKKRLLVDGGPGTGKTTTAARKVAQIAPMLGENEHILFLTFTNNATDRIREALVENVGAAERKKIALTNYHSLFFHLIVAWHRWVGLPITIQLMSAAEHTELYAAAIKLLRQEGFDAKRESRIPRWFSHVLAYRDGMLGAVEERTLEGIKLAASVKERVHREGRLHFDDFDYYAIRILGSTKILDACRRRYPVVIVDEFQDISDLQYLFLKKIAVNGFWYAFGDSEQTIYRFAGASPTRMDDFERDEGAHRVTLKGSRRYPEGSGIASIADALRSMAATSPESWTKCPISSNDVDFHGCKSRSHQIAYAAKMLPGLNPRDNRVVCLLPTNREVRDLGIKLAENRIPYRAITDSEDEFLWEEALIAGIEATGEAQLERLARSADHALHANQYRRPKGIAELAEILDGAPPNGSLGERVSYLASAFSALAPDDAAPVIESARQGVLRSAARLPESRRSPEQLTRLVQQRRIQDQFRGRSETNRGITLMTMHRGKGKEFDSAVMFAPDAGGFLGGPREDDLERKDDLRTWHMTLSRAREKLVIFYTQRVVSPYLAPFLP